MKVLVFLSCGLVLNQDFQDFEDFLALGYDWDGARSSMKFKKYPLFSTPMR
jgi:hypothetical protein